MRLLWVAMLLLAGVGSRPKLAHAQSARFAWQGPDCSSSEALFQKRLELLVDEPDLRRLAGSVAVAHEGENWLVEVAIALDGQRLGRRRFVTKSCEHAAETAAVAASMAVFDGGPAPEVALRSGISPDIWTQRPDPVPDFSRPKPAAPPPLPREHLEPRFGLLAAAEVGALPRPVLGAGIEAELALTPSWSAALIGSVTAEQERSIAAGQLARLRAFAATARGCATPAGGPAFHIDVCAGLRFMQVRGQGDGFDINRSASLRWIAPLLGFNLALRAPRYLEWRFELDGSVPLSRRRFLLDGQQISRADVVVLGVRLGPVLRFR